ncbi:MAG: hypothetical protein ACE14L_14195 [Terriglobales bacterium]
MARTTGGGRSSGRANARTQAGGSRSANAGRPGRSRTASTRGASASRLRRQAGKSAQRRGGQPSARSTRASAAQRRQARPISGSRKRTRALTDHDEIRRWAEERGARPACVRRTGGGEDVGMIRLDFPGFGGEESLEHISWDEWFRKFDESNLALLVQDTTARGEKSNFNKLVGRETAEKRSRGISGASRRHPERETGRRSAKRQPTKAAKVSRRGEPPRKMRTTAASKMNKQRAASSGTRSTRRKAA